MFNRPTTSFQLEVDLVAELTVINPFDFFLDSDAMEFPFTYASWLGEELRPYLKTLNAGPALAQLLTRVSTKSRRTVDFLVDLNRLVHDQVQYVIRMEPGVQTCEETLAHGTGSCRDSAWLLVQVLRHLGLAARFVSGYLIQLKPDIKSLDGPPGPDQDFTDLHAWAEVYLPGAGWVGLDPTSGLFTGEGSTFHGHCALMPASAAPISGAVDPCETQFGFFMSVKRVLESPRVSKPYTDDQWQQIQQLGHKVDAALEVGDVRRDDGGEPTFVSVDDMDGSEWNTDALRAEEASAGRRTCSAVCRSGSPKAPCCTSVKENGIPANRFPAGRWAVTGGPTAAPIWRDPKLVADDSRDYHFGPNEASAHNDPGRSIARQCRERATRL